VFNAKHESRGLRAFKRGLVHVTVLIQTFQQFKKWRCCLSLPTRLF